MPDRFPKMQTAEPDVTGTAYDEMNSLIYLDDMQNAPTAPEGTKKPSFLMSMLEMAPGYNPIQKMMEAETMTERVRQLPTFLIGLGAVAGGGKKPSKIAIPYRGKMETQYSRSLEQPIKTVKKFVEDWFTSSESKKRAADALRDNLPYSLRKLRPIPLTEGPPATKGGFGDPIEMVTERIEEMRKADIPELLKYDVPFSGGTGGEWVPPFQSAEANAYRGITDYKTFTDATKRLGRVTISPQQSPVTDTGQGLLAHEFTHMAEGGWYHDALVDVIKPHIEYDAWLRHSFRDKERIYLSQPREVLARVMQLRYDYFQWLGKTGPPRKRGSAPSEFAYKFQNVGDDFFKSLERKKTKPKYYHELSLIFKKDKLKKMVNTLPAAAALLLGESAIRQDNATSK